MREKFSFFRDQLETIEKLPVEYQAECFIALARYNLDGVVSQGISPIAAAILRSFQKLIDTDIAYQTKQIENGKKGGRPPKEEIKPNHNPKETIQTTNDILQSLFVNNSISHTKERTRKYLEFFYTKIFGDQNPTPQFFDATVEVLSVILQALDTTESKLKFTFNGKKYDFSGLCEIFNTLTDEDFCKITENVRFRSLEYSKDTEPIQNRFAWILGTIFNKSEQRKLKEKGLS